MGYSLARAPLHLSSLGFQSKLSGTLMSIKDPSSLEEKVRLKASTSSDLRQHNIYPSWININP